MKILLTLLALLSISMSTFADGPIYHVVHFKFKPATDAASIKKVETEFAALKPKISAIESLQWGTNISKEGFDAGYTHCWILTFKDEAGRDAYLLHPEHKKFVELVVPLLEKPFVIDFVPQK